MSLSSDFSPLQPQVPVRIKPPEEATAHAVGGSAPDAAAAAVYADLQNIQSDPNWLNNPDNAQKFFNDLQALSQDLASNRNSSPAAAMAYSWLANAQIGSGYGNTLEQALSSGSVSNLVSAMNTLVSDNHGQIFSAFSNAINQYANGDSSSLSPGSVVAEELSMIQANGSLSGDSIFMSMVQADMQNLVQTAGNNAGSSVTAAMVNSWLANAQINVGGTQTTLAEAISLGPTTLGNALQSLVNEGHGIPFNCFLNSVQQMQPGSGTPINPGAVVYNELSMMQANSYLTGDSIFMSMVQSDMQKLSVTAGNDAPNSLSAAIVLNWLNNAQINVGGTQTTLEEAMQMGPGTLGNALQSLMNDFHGMTFSTFMNAVGQMTPGSSSIDQNAGVMYYELQQLENNPSLLGSSVFSSMFQGNMNSFFSEISASSSPEAAAILKFLTGQQEGGVTWQQAMSSSSSMQKYCQALLNDPKNLQSLLANIKAFLS